MARQQKVALHKAVDDSIVPVVSKETRRFAALPLRRRVEGLNQIPRRGEAI
jgi:hypothetical protein